MAVVSWREVLPRTLSHRFGESPTAETKVVATVDAPTSSQEVINTVGVFHGDPHPEFSYLRMLDSSLTETDRHHVEITYRYELPKQEDLDPNPLARPDVWSFRTGGAQVPALTYYEGTGNSTLRALTNSANDFFEGVTSLESEVRASISGNRSQFPLTTAAAVTNCVNSAAYLGGPAHSWQCSGISGQQATEVVNGVELRYWQVTAELVYRKSGWNLPLPNVGWHYIVDGERRRAYVIDWDNKEYLPSASPRPLTESGNLKAGDEYPDILVRRVFPEVDFSIYFGTPPF